jgi:hypothetical protein
MYSVHIKSTVLSPEPRLTLKVGCHLMILSLERQKARRVTLVIRKGKRSTSHH